MEYEEHRRSIRKIRSPHELRVSAVCRLSDSRYTIRHQARLLKEPRIKDARTSAEHIQLMTRRIREMTLNSVRQPVYDIHRS